MTVIERIWKFTDQFMSSTASTDMPSDTKDGEFTECDGDLQDEVGIYTTNGQGELSINAS